MKTVQDFFVKCAGEIRSKYFPTVKYYRDDKDCADATYALECFSNGVLTYSKLIDKLAKSCSDTKENIHAVVSQYVADFEGYLYSATAPRKYYVLYRAQSDTFKGMFNRLSDEVGKKILRRLNPKATLILMERTQVTDMQGGETEPYTGMWTFFETPLDNIYKVTKGRQMYDYTGLVTLIHEKGKVFTFDQYNERKSGYRISLTPLQVDRIISLVELESMNDFSKHRAFYRGLTDNIKVQVKSNFHYTPKKNLAVSGN